MYYKCRTKWRIFLFRIKIYIDGNGFIVLLGKEQQLVRKITLTSNYEAKFQLPLYFRIQYNTHPTILLTTIGKLSPVI